MGNHSSIVSLGLRASYDGEIKLNGLLSSKEHFVIQEGNRSYIALGVHWEMEAEDFEITKWQALREEQYFLSINHEEELTRLPFFFVTSDFDPLSERDPSWEGWGKQRVYLPRAFLCFEKGEGVVDLILHLEVQQNREAIISCYHECQGLQDIDLQGWLLANQSLLSAGIGQEEYQSLRAFLATNPQQANPQQVNQPKDHALKIEAFDIEYEQSLEAWTSFIDLAKEELTHGKNGLQKLVCARRAGIDLHKKGSRLNALDSFERICSKFKEVEGIHCFWIQRSNSGLCFMGATPELLMACTGQNIQTHALAGTIRLNSNQSIAALGQSLLEDQKERKEHALVVEQILESLQDFTGLCYPQSPRLKKAGHLLHLETPMSVQISPHQERQALALIKALHPTPALGGRPKQAALAWLRANEHIGRGNYGAPLGWFNAQAKAGLYAKLLVGIRAFLYHSSLRKIYLYGGVGIVAESKAEKEWQESLLKMTSLIDQISIEKDE